ncbi:MAG: amidase family protein, partial [Acidobacteriota bacterium]
IPFGGVLDSLTQIGPMARWVEDLALTLPIIAGVDGHDPGVIPMTLRHPRDVSLERLRVAFYTDNGISTPAPEITAAVRRAAEVLSDSVGFVEEDRPPGIEDSLVYGDLVVATLGVDRWLREAGTKRPHELLRGLLARQRATVMRASDLDELVTRWDRFRLAMHSFLAKYDLILCPVHAGAALPHGTTSEPDKARGFSYTPAYNLTGWPAVVVRTGATREGLPVGVQVVAQPWREDVALAAAQHIETALGGWRRPDL